MNAIRRIEGERFGRLVVVKLGVKPAGYRHGNALWICKCDCGKTVTVSSANLRNGTTLSCGCFHSERASDSTSKRFTTHGHRPRAGRSPTYTSWRSMWLRCTNRNHISYSRYGGRGIKVCKRWENFANFLADMGLRPAGKTIDRKNNDGNYHKRNCKWSTPLEQARNRRQRK